MREILLIDDNESDGLLAVRAFRQAGIPNPVVVMRDSGEALAYLLAEGIYGDRRHAPLPAVVLLDWNMPRLNGREVLRRLRQEERTRTVPVVILSSSREEKDIADGYALGANSYIQKPVDFVRFVETVRIIGSYWLDLNELPPAPRVPDSGGK